MATVLFALVLLLAGLAMRLQSRKGPQA